MKYIQFLIIITIFFVSSVFGQDKIYNLNYMYLGDTLDYCDGGTQKINVIFNKINYDSTRKYYLFTGKMCDSKDDSPIDSSIGLIFLGEIEEIKAKTWLGYIHTGLLKKIEQYKLNRNGEFLILVPAETKYKLIFTGFACEVKIFSIPEVLKLKD